jgi:hypothetical protein
VTGPGASVCQSVVGNVMHGQHQPRVSMSMNHGRTASRRITCKFEMMASADILPSAQLPMLELVHV